MGKEQIIPLRAHHLNPIKNAMINQDQEALDSLVDLKIACSPHREVDKPNSYQEVEKRYLDGIGEKPINNYWSLKFPSSKMEYSYFGKLRSALNRYLKLPDNSILKLTATGKDWLCEQECFGEHCLSKIGEDSEMLIMKNLRRFKTDEKIDGFFVVRDHKKYSELYAMTTMGVLRNIIDRANGNLLSIMYHLPHSL